MEKAMKGELNLQQKVSSLSEDYKNCTLEFVLKDIATNIMGLNFELIEEPEEIDIQGIKELEKANCPAIHRNEAFYIKDNRDKIGELIQAVKQLDKKQKEGK